MEPFAPAGVFCGSALPGGGDGAIASIENAKSSEKNSEKKSGTEQCAPGPSRQASLIRPVTKTSPNLRRPPARQVRSAALGVKSYPAALRRPCVGAGRR
jgi:hypothetical protein